MKHTSDIYAVLRHNIVNHVSKTYKGFDTSTFSIEPPNNPDHGDAASNIAFMLSKQLKKSPHEIATTLAEDFSKKYNVNVAVHKSGFLNFTFSNSSWAYIIKSIIENNASLEQFLDGTSLNIEFVSANPTGPLHVGHTRGAIYGNSLVKLLKSVGCNITSEYYVNDAGSQIDKLNESVKAVKNGQEPPEDGYKGDYIIELAAMEGEPTDLILELIKQDLSELGVEFDVFTSEKEIKKHTELVLSTLKDKGHTYEKDGALFFKSTDFGDDKDRVIIKTDGEHTYFSGDIAYHYDKINRGHTNMLNIFGADHGGYVTRLQSIIQALDSSAKLDVELIQLVKLMQNGKEVNMSKRDGTYVTLRDVLDKVGKDAIRFIMLMQGNNKGLVFDIDKAIEVNMSNPLWYVQYAHARICSLLGSKNIIVPNSLDDVIKNESTHKLLQKLSQWPYITKKATFAREPHRIAVYSYELAGCFHSFYKSGGKINNPLDQKVSAQKQAICQATKFVLAESLAIVGVEPLNRL